MSNTNQLQKDDTGEWTTVTATATSGPSTAIAPATSLLSTLRYTIIGKTMFYEYRYRQVGAGTAGQLHVYLPKGLRGTNTTCCGNGSVTGPAGSSSIQAVMSGGSRAILFLMPDTLSVGPTGRTGALDSASVSLDCAGTIALI